MKAIVSILLLFACINPCYSQDASLTKAETVNYINKKLKETIGQKTEEGYVLDCEMKSLDDDFYQIYYYFGSHPEKCSTNNNDKFTGEKYTSTFKIEHIKNIGFFHDELNRMSLYFLGSVVRKTRVHLWKMIDTRNGQSILTCEESGYNITNKNSTISNPLTQVSNVRLYLLKSETNKVLKAFNHLIALYKAEDDPFGN